MKKEYIIEQTGPAEFYIRMEKRLRYSGLVVWKHLDMEGRAVESRDDAFVYYTLQSAKKRAQHFIDNPESYPIYHNL